ncbi:MAG TPA: rhomboid family intramembrane serine protease [Thermoanaerobaculia bacterium]
MFPIRDTIPSRHVPVATWLIIGVNVVVFLLELANPAPVVEQMTYLFGIVPARYTHPEWARSVGFPSSYWPFVTSMFLHGGWLHVIGNMWALWIFGDNVEDRMGPLRFLLFYGICGVAAGLVHLLTNTGSTVPAIGASGAIAGVMAAYFILFPRARIVAMFPIVFWPVFFEVPAFLYLGFWFFVQFFSGATALVSPERASGIAWWAHVGGFATGALTFWIFIRPRARRVPHDTFFTGGIA